MLSITHLDQLHEQILERVRESPESVLQMPSIGSHRKTNCSQSPFSAVSAQTDEARLQPLAGDQNRTPAEMSAAATTTGKET